MPDILSIPGLGALWEQTLGDPRVCVAVIDGPPDLSHPCLRDASLTRLPSYWLEPREVEDRFAAHATHVCSVLFSPHDTEVQGVAPRCRGLSIPVAYDTEGAADPYHIVRALDAAREAGAQVIHVAVVLPTRTGTADSLLERAVQTCLESNILVVAPAGNDRGECWTMPAALPGVLAVGAMSDVGRPFLFSNFGGILQEQGVLAPGENVLGAKVGGGTVRQKGTSSAAPIVSGVAALLMSLQLKSGRAISAAAVRDAILRTALPCDPDVVREPVRCLRGKLNLPGAQALIAEGAAEAELSGAPGLSEEAAGGVFASQARPQLVYALGTLAYDFGSEARRDTFKQLMPPVSVAGAEVPANPYDARQMLAYLTQDPPEARSLIWALHYEQTPVYAVRPVGPYAHHVYQRLRLLLAGALEAEASEGYIERVSVPGRLTGRSVRLFSGQVVPEVEIEMLRGLFGWKVNRLIEAALMYAALDDAERERARRSLRGFLNRIYFDLRNLGVTSRSRALNFAATNAFQAAATFAEAVREGLDLDRIEVVRSPVCRMASDCWDVKLRFFDPENRRRARRVFRFTIDVSDMMPVTMGQVRTWRVED